MNILTAINEKYLEPLSVMLYSLCVNNPCAMSVYIMHFEISEKSQDEFRSKLSKWGYPMEIYFKQCDRGKFAKIQNNNRYGQEANLRLLMLDVLPDNMDRILWLDTDIIVKGNLGKLYDYEDRGQCALACHDMFPSAERHAMLLKLEMDKNAKYFNTGVVLFYIKNMRKHFETESFLQWMDDNPKKLNYPDQNTLNVCLKGKVVYANPEKYNLQMLRVNKASDKIKHAKIIHYNTKVKPWQSDYSGAGGSLYWKYAISVLGIHRMVIHYWRKCFKGVSK